MIINLANRITKDIYHGINSRHARQIPKELHGKICRLLDQLDAVTQVEMLQIPPSNHLEKLKGKSLEYWSLRINIKWRVIFKWEKGNAHEVAIVDYH